MPDESSWIYHDDVVIVDCNANEILYIYLVTNPKIRIDTYYTYWGDETVWVTDLEYDVVVTIESAGKLERIYRIDKSTGDYVEYVEPDVTSQPRPPRPDEYDYPIPF